MCFLGPRGMFVLRGKGGQGLGSDHQQREGYDRIISDERGMIKVDEGHSIVYCTAAPLIRAERNGGGVIYGHFNGVDPRGGGWGVVEECG